MSPEIRAACCCVAASSGRSGFSVQGLKLYRRGGARGYDLPDFALQDLRCVVRLSLRGDAAAETGNHIHVRACPLGQRVVALMYSRAAVRNWSASVRWSTARATTIAPTHIATRASARSRALGSFKLRANTS